MGYFVFKAHMSNRICNALALVSGNCFFDLKFNTLLKYCFFIIIIKLQCVASHDETRSLFLQGNLLNKFVEFSHVESCYIFHCFISFNFKAKI